MNKKRNFAKLALLGALLCGLASPTFVGCKDYDDDIKDLQEQIDANKSAATQELSKAISEQITALENKLNTAIADKMIFCRKLRMDNMFRKSKLWPKGLKLPWVVEMLSRSKMGLMEQMGPMVSMEFLRCCISRLSMA